MKKKEEKNKEIGMAHSKFQCKKRIILFLCIYLVYIQRKLSNPKLNELLLFSSSFVKLSFRKQVSPLPLH